ncbi:MAG: 3'-5' exonuclease domain-containing protein 2 [Odoribacter sp.]|nr:3'-5' exonuclease domain-containing protein 2 [Odoribacter sp.]
MLTKFKKNISREEMEQLPLFVFSGEVTVVEDPVEAERIVELLQDSVCLGFDTETRPAFHKGEHYDVGLLQLSTPEHAYLFRLKKCGWSQPLRDLLANPRKVKVGVGIRGDLRALEQLGSFVPASFVDLQEYAVRFGIEDKSFSKLMGIVCQVRVSKRQRTSNWDAPVLSEAQIRYAATDAWGALEIYTRLSNEN